VRDGDIISISIPERKITLDATKGEITQRMNQWNPPPPRVTSGILVDWHLLATQFDEGAMVRRIL
jgi:dihydroxy-acid dehydratase